MLFVFLFDFAYFRLLGNMIRYFVRFFVGCHSNVGTIFKTSRCLTIRNWSHIAIYCITMLLFFLLLFFLLGRPLQKSLIDSVV